MASSTAAVTSVIIFTNDATELSFSDGTKLELSPCGASFACTRLPTRGQHPLGGDGRVQQRTEFATSEFRSKVGQALECRNRFADCPYLCRRFLHDGAVLKLFADIQEVKWTKTPEIAFEKVHPNGTIQVTSVDECASLFLSANRQEFTVEFLCRLSRKDASKKLGKQRGKLSRHPERNRDMVDTGPGRDLVRETSGDRWKLSSRPVCLQDSPYLQTLDPARPSLRPSPRDSENHSRIPFMSRQTGSPETAGRTGDGFPFQDDENGGKQAEELIADNYGYTWVVQHHTVEYCPDCWKHPLYLAQNSALREHVGTSQTENGANTSSVGSTAEQGTATHHPSSSPELTQTNCQNLQGRNDIKEAAARPRSEFEREPSDETSGSRQEMPFEAVRSPLPSPLPLTCPASHLHRWRKEDKAGDGDDNLKERDIPSGHGIKVWFSNGIIYRLSRAPQPAVLVFPGDGTLVKSTGPDGSYFAHIIPHDGSLDERMLCIRSLPPDSPGSAYSLQGVLRKAFRLLQNVVRAEFGVFPSDERCCWKETLLSPPSTKPKPTVVLEESKVEGLGHFVAFSNGRVRIVFDDRTTLDTEWDFQSRLGGNARDGDSSQNVSRHHEASTRMPKIRKSFFASGLQKGVCQLLLPDGVQRQVPTDDPQEFYRYVGVAVEWATWVASSPEERQTFYVTEEPQLSQQNWSVQSELQKMKRFEYILENTLSPSGVCTTRSRAEGAISNGKTASNSDPSPLCRHAVVSADAGSDVPTRLEVSPPAFVRDALQRTSSAIQNIDAVLGRF